MANESTKLEDRLLELGKGLASPPSSADELYSLLHLIDGLLSIVEQSPSASMLDALQPLMKALAVKEFLRHSNMDVKVAVASCISEITRITAPEAPYDDDIMKEIFQMIVEAFEGLDDMSSRSFQKRVSILETVAKVRSCVVMLDLECDALILRMFHHFLKTIRTDHSENVFTSMKTIMTLVIDESEDISSDLLTALLDTSKKDNKYLPIAKQLAEKVMGTCASKLKPYMVELIQSRGASLSEYSEVVASICQESSGALDHVETHVSREALEDDSKLSERTVSDELPQVSAKLEQEVGCPEKVGTAAETSPVAATSNGDVQMGNGDTMEQPSSPKRKSERSRRNGQSKNVASDGTDIGNVESTAVKPDGTTDLKKAKGRKTNSSAQLTDNIDRMDSDKDASVVTSRRKGPYKEGEAASAQEGESISAQDGETAVSLEPDKKNELQHLPGSDGPTSDPLPSPISSPPDSSRAKRGRPAGQKGTAKRSDVDAANDTPVPSSVQNDPAENSQAHDEVMPSKGDDSKEPEDADDVEAPTGLTSNSEVKPRRNTGKKGRLKRKVVEREYSGTKQNSNTKKQKEEESHGKDVDREPSLKEMASSPGFASKAPSVDETCLDDSVKTKSRRKRALETKKISETPDHKKQLDEHLVGSRIKVWWPDDKMFYEGTVDSYDPVTRKHKIVYTDGDVEVLMLKKERWESAESDSGNDGRKRKAEGSASQMPQNKKAKGSSLAPSKQARSQSQSKSGTEISSRDVPRPRGRPRSGTSDIGKLSYENSPGTPKKSKGISSDKEKTPRSSGKKLKDGPDNEPEDGNTRTSSKREESGNMSKKLASKPDSAAAKGDTFKNSRKLKDEPSKSGRKSSNETLKASTKLKDDGSKSGDDTTPKTASRDEPDEDGKKKTPRMKPKTNSTAKAGGDSKANGVTSKGKTKVGESESTAQVSDGEATTGGRKRKRRGRK